MNVGWNIVHVNEEISDITPGGGGVLSPFDGGGVRPEKKYRGVRELLFIPKKGGVRELE